MPPESDHEPPHVNEGVPAESESERRVTRSSSDATTRTTVFRLVHNGYRPEPVDSADRSSTASFAA